VLAKRDASWVAVVLEDLLERRYFAAVGTQALGERVGQTWWSLGESKPRTPVTSRGVAEPSVQLVSSF
jgi:hypothetical protein